MSRVSADAIRRLELEGYDPRGLLIPPNPGLRSLTVRDVQDADDWLEDLLSRRSEPDDEIGPRFPNLRHLSLHSTTLLSFPILPLDRLTHLDLSFNLLNAIPSTLSSIPSLRSLNLSNNLITSLRNAPSALGNSTSLNLSRNRIDCLVGLERVLALERIDVRANELAEADEVGRLAVLPHVREVWCANNLFDRPSVGDEWRIELGAAYAAEGRAEVVFDDQPWTWAESRRIESLLSSRGKTSHSHLHGTESSHRPQTSSKLPTPNPTTSLSATETGVTNPTLSALPLKKRRPRRVINLEDPNSQSEEDEPTSALVGGSLRLPESTAMIEDRKERGSTFRVDRRKERRARVSASMFEPNTGGLDGKG